MGPTRPCRKPVVRSRPSASSRQTDIGALGAPGLILGHDRDEDPTLPSPKGVACDSTVDGAPHTEKTPSAQLELVEPCRVLPALPTAISVRALAPVKNMATVKAINSRKHLRAHDLMLFVFRS